MMMSPVDFVAAVSARLADAQFLVDDGIRFVAATLVSDPTMWPVTIDVRFLDPDGVAYVWSAGSYTYTEIPGIGDCDTEEDAEFVVNDWCVVAVTNICEWVVVRDYESWPAVRPEDES